MNDITRIDTDDRHRPVPVLPSPNVDITIRPAVEGDYPFIDALQKQHSKAVGFMWEAAIKGHIAKGNVLVAEAAPGREMADGGCGMADGVEKAGSAGSSIHHPPSDIHHCPVGYLIAVDRYLKRDELGIVYQLNVAPGRQRGLIGANLLKAQFDRSAYGCRLYCCWCAQDLQANHFWEAMGFVPLAFRTGGGRGKTKKDGKFRGRMHIFWQKRIREHDDFPYWFPSLTGAGAIGEDRIVLPIPPRMHWSDAKPVVLPQGSSGNEETLLLEAKVSELEKAKKGIKKGISDPAPAPGSNPAPGSKKAKKADRVAAGGLHFGPPPPPEVSADEAEAKKDAAEAARIEVELKEAKKAARKAKKKFDPAQEAYARELKDKWLEQIVAEPGLLVAANAKYDVSRQLPEGRVDRGGGDELLRLDAA